MKRFAFTMLELVFVIIIIGILAVLAMPSLNGNQLQFAAEQVASHIRYAQHLALTDDKYDPTDSTWYEKRWQIRFLNNGTVYYYDVFSDNNKEGNSNEDEEAIDPMTHERLGSGNTTNTPTDAVDLSKFGITAVGGTCQFGGTHKLVFDNFGRPYLSASSGLYSNPVPQNGCTIILEHGSEGNATLTIQSQTGYVGISY